MLSRGHLFYTFLTALLPLFAHADTAAQDTNGLRIELNTLNDTGAACRMTFLAENATDTDIAQAVFETVIFDTQGGVMSLTLFDFRDLPAGKPRVRQFDVPGISCETLGQVLINGASTCTAQNAESSVCDKNLSLSSRLTVELLG